jgi:hypothetical protein
MPHPVALTPTSNESLKKEKQGFLSKLFGGKKDKEKEKERERAELAKLAQRNQMA